MTQLRISITKGRASDHIEIERSNGDLFRFDFPKKGPIPHDAVHYFVERALSMKSGFWGMVAAGTAPDDVQDIAKAGGHASAKRAGIPDAKIVELLQAERIVECFEADAWSAPASGETFRGVVEAACACSFVAAPTLADTAIERIRSDIADFAQKWRAAPIGAQFDFEFDSAFAD